MSNVFNVFIGRFQPAHNAHLQIIRGALESKYDTEKYQSNPNHVIICIGSANKPRTPRDPFSAAEREEMLRSALSAEENARVHCAYISDSLYNNTQWAREVQNAVNGIVSSVSGADDDVIRLVGHKKDDTSFYLDMFPQWKFIGIRNIDDLHSTTIRDYYLNTKWDNEKVDVFLDMCEDYIDPCVLQWLIEFRSTPDFEHLREEFTFIEKYKEMWAGSPYPPVFVTCDGVVIQSGHILLVRRKAAPGKGLLALPGGYVDQNEHIVDAVIRELREETNLKVPEPVLRGSIQETNVFDHPKRSLRGRTVTHAFLIKLNPGPLPKVKGGDDAAKAMWMPVDEVLNMEDQLFEDHASIIKYFVGRA
jgi:bifunctional NMN adenylyltransferase/nudix hydrolase